MISQKYRENTVNGFIQQIQFKGFNLTESTQGFHRLTIETCMNEKFQGTETNSFSSQKSVQQYRKAESCHDSIGVWRVKQSEKLL